MRPIEFNEISIMSMVFNEIFVETQNFSSSLILDQRPIEFNEISIMSMVLMKQL